MTTVASEPLEAAGELSTLGTEAVVTVPLVEVPDVDVVDVVDVAVTVVDVDVDVDEDVDVVVVVVVDEEDVVGKVPATSNKYVLARMPAWVCPPEKNINSKDETKPTSWPM